MFNINPIFSAGRVFTNGALEAIRDDMAKEGTAFRDRLRDIVHNFFKEVKNHFKLGAAGATVNEQFKAFLKELKLDNLFEDAARKAGQGFNSAAEGFTDEMDNAANTFGEGIKRMGETIGKGLGGAIGKTGKPIAEAIGDLTGDFFKNITLNSVPYIAAGAALLMGVPLLTLYAYHRAKHSIGRPRLAAEVGYAGLIDRTQDKVSRATKGALEVAVPGLKAGAIGGFLALAAYLPIMLPCGYNHCVPTLEEFNRIYLYYGFWGGIVIPAAAASGLALARKVKDCVKSFFYSVPDARAIFHTELQKKIDQITTSTYNLQKNGGFFQNVLLYGPGGTGKTMIAKLIARNSNMNYVMMSGGDLAQYIKNGEHVTELNRLFDSIKSSHSPTILFIDEFESLAGDRKRMKKAELFELLNAFLSHTGEASNKFMIIAATNMPNLIDPAVLSRMDHKLLIEPPKPEQRLAILSQYVDRFFTRAEKQLYFPASTLAKINSQTEGLTGRALFKMVNAIHSHMLTTANKQLTPEAIQDIVHHFVNQEVEIKKWQKPSPTPHRDASAAAG